MFRHIAGERELTRELIVKTVSPGALEASGVPRAKAIQRVRAARNDVARFVQRRTLQLSDSDAHVIEVPPGQTESQIARTLRSTGNFAWVQPNYRVYVVGCPNDALLTSQWHHDPQRMASCQGWEINAGDPGITVAVCDSGVDVQHPDLDENRVEGYNSTSQLFQSAGGEITPTGPHGTWVAGCVAAEGDNAFGVSGVAQRIAYRPVRVTENGNSTTLNVLIDGVLTAANAGDEIINVSFSGVDAPIVADTASTLRSMGSLLIWSAGNDSRVLSGADRDDDELIVVGATDLADRPAEFSARGPFVDLVAPGVDIFTTAPGGGFDAVSGTSFSAPLASGVAALVWSNSPGFTPQQVEDALKQGVDDLGDTGVDDTFGYSRTNVAGSLGFERPVFFSFPDGRPETISPFGGDTPWVQIDPGVAEPIPASASLHIGADGVCMMRLMSTISNNLYEATFPPTTCLSDVRYFVSVMTDEAEQVTFPFAAPTFAFDASAVVDTRAVAVFTTEDPSGWTVEESPELLSGSWAIGVADNDPLVVGDPAEGADGSGSAWLTGPPDVDPDGPVDRDTDVDEGSTRLITPAIDLTTIAGVSGRLTLRYSLYFLDGGQLGTPQSDAAGELLVEITDNGEEWQTLEFVPSSTALTDRDTRAQWLEREFVLGDGFERTGQVRLRFTATNETPLDDLFGDAFGEKTEAAIDGLSFFFERCDGIAPCSPADLVPPFGQLTSADVERAVQLVIGGGPFGDCDGSRTTDFSMLMTILNKIHFAAVKPPASARVIQL